MASRAGQTPPANAGDAAKTCRHAGMARATGMASGNKSSQAITPRLRSFCAISVSAARPSRQASSRATASTASVLRSELRSR